MILIRPKENKSHNDRLLSLLLLNISLLIASNLLQPLLDDNLLLYNLNVFLFFCLYLLCPAILLAFIIRCFDQAIAEILRKTLIWSTVPPFVIGMVLFFFYLPDIRTVPYKENRWYPVLYLFMTLPYLPLFLYGGRFLIKKKKQLGAGNSLWNLCTLGIAGVFVAFILERLRLYRAAATVLSVLLFIVDFFLIRQPDLRNSSLKMTVRKKEGDSGLSDHEISEIEKKLAPLLYQEKLYLNPASTISDWSERAGISSHRLSLYLNSCRKMNFNSYVNSFRIRHAIDLLIADPKQKILTVCYESGFNSPSTFYAAFKEETRMTPREYLKKKT